VDLNPVQRGVKVDLCPQRSLADANAQARNSLQNISIGSFVQEPKIASRFVRRPWPWIWAVATSVATGAAAPTFQVGANSGDTLEVRLKGFEPIRNVPRSVKDLGHSILSFDPEPGEAAEGIHLLRLKKT